MTHTGAYPDKAVNRPRLRFEKILRFHTAFFDDLHRHELPKIISRLNEMDGGFVDEVSDFIELGVGLSRPFDQQRMDTCAAEVCSQITKRDAESFAVWFERLRNYFDALSAFVSAHGIAPDQIMPSIDGLDQQADRELKTLSIAEEYSLLITAMSVQSGLEYNGIEEQVVIAHKV